jgi:transcriptional regulator with XRE-family HTH domain
MKKNNGGHINILRQYRKFMKYTQEDVANIIGVKKVNTISQWEKGETLPDFESLFKLSILYKVLPEVLFLETVSILREEVLIEIQKQKIKKDESISDKNINKSIR